MMVSNCISHLWIYCNFHYKCIFNGKKIEKSILSTAETDAGCFFKALYIWFWVILNPNCLPGINEPQGNKLVDQTCGFLWSMTTLKILVACSCCCVSITAGAGSSLSQVRCSGEWSVQLLPVLPGHKVLLSLWLLWKMFPCAHMCVHKWLCISSIPV